MDKKSVLLICGGGSTEHEISLISANYIQESLKDIKNINIYRVTIEKDGRYVLEDGKTKCELDQEGHLNYADNRVYIHYAIPCIHGPPGETGEIQAIFESCKIPYLGCGPSISFKCFDKVTTKFWLSALGVNNTPYKFVVNKDESKKKDVIKFFHDHGGKVFIKAASQGSSVGCYLVETEDEVWPTIIKATQYSREVLVEKALVGRELELAAYEMDGLHITDPGEIIVAGKFYDYDQKYSNTSQTKTVTKAKDLDKLVVDEMKEMAKKAYQGIGIKDLARIDFFLTEDGKLYLNEPNTFPGMTPISMFPKMMEANSHKFSDFIQFHIEKHSRS